MEYFTTNQEHSICIVAQTDESSLFLCEEQHADYYGIALPLGDQRLFNTITERLSDAGLEVEPYPDTYAQSWVFVSESKLDGQVIYQLLEGL